MSTQEAPPETTNPGMLADLVCRVTFAAIANLVCWVPFRLLWKNGEFAAAVFCFNVMLLNTFYGINALIWRDDDVANWFDGRGWCDLQAYIVFPMMTLYAACIFAMMRHLAMQLGLLRATSLTKKEKRRRNLIQALIIFPVPLLQVAMTYPLLENRYWIMGLQGCRAMYDPNPLFLTFFILPAPIFVIGALFYAALAYKSFREVSKTTRAAHTGNSTAASRNSRAKRKLYVMTISVLLPFTPVQIGFLFVNIASNMPWTKPFDFTAIHSPPERWSTIPLVPASSANFIDVHVCYIPIITAIPLFLFYGTTKEALNVWRRYLLFFGLGKLFPALNNEYDPDRPAARNPTSLQSWGGSTVASDDRKASLAREQQHPHQQQSVAPLADQTHSLDLNGSSARSSSPLVPAASLLPTYDPYSNRAASDEEETRAPPRNPFLFRTAMATPLKMQPFPFPKFGRKSSKTGKSPVLAPMRAVAIARSVSAASRRDKGGNREPDDQTGETSNTARGNWESSPAESLVETRVWSEEEGRLPAASAVTSAEKRWALTPAPPHDGGGVHVETHIATSSSEKVAGLRN